jgi:hypothetical protein
MSVKYSKRPYLNYINISQYKALKNCPKWDFWFENKPSGNPGLCYAPVIESVSGRNIFIDKIYKIL